MKALRSFVIALFLVIGCLPLVWLVLTAFKHHPDTITVSAKFLPLPSAPLGGGGIAFAPTLEGFEHLAEPHPGMEFSFLDHLLNSILIGVASTVASVALGTSCAYGFSRFRIP